MSDPAPDELLDRARAWAAADPDPVTRAALRAAVDARDIAELHVAMATPLAFGTAGLRGPVGPGPGRMNRATVIRTTRGLAEHVVTSRPRSAAEAPLVVVGFDARPDSATFAWDAVAVLAATGVAVRCFSEPVPTPLVAYAARMLSAAAAVVVTASHNPPADNGYKVFGRTASQIVAPEDEQIAARIAVVGPAADVPWEDPDTSPRVRPLGEETVLGYLAGVAATVPPSSAGAGPVIVHTPLHGVAGPLVQRALAQAGLRHVHPVPSQAEPDGTFPTVAFPNPEEPGALDEALAEAARRDADLVLANDPDGDRLAVAVAVPGGYRQLSGNEVGMLLGDHLLASTRAPRPLVVSSIVSSPMFASVASVHGARHETTLTGFKWICRAAMELEQREGFELVLGYEEALGYAVGGLVRDKDGISAAVAVADLARGLAERGSSLIERLGELFVAHGLWVSVQHGVVLPPDAVASRVARALDRLVQHPPTDLAGWPVAGVVDHRIGRDDQPDWLPPSVLVEVRLEGGGRALLRPSGTEPKCKVYVDLRADADSDQRAQGEALRQEARAVAHALVASAGLG
jgi:phosphomannomutase